MPAARTGGESGSRRRLCLGGRFLHRRFPVAVFPEQIADVEEADVKHVADDEGGAGGLDPFEDFHVYRLAAEALRNAFRHAAAKNVEVELRYDEKYFRLHIRDDGKGIASDVLSGDGRQGHYGLPGMRERARLIGGKLSIWTELNTGTEIELIIPGARAYVKQARPFWYFGKRSATEADEKETIERE